MRPSENNFLQDNELLAWVFDLLRSGNGGEYRLSCLRSWTKANLEQIPAEGARPLMRMMQAAR
jgi:hypothetical protein